MTPLRAWLALGALALAVSFTFMNSPFFLHFAIQADTLYPALLAEDLRADWGALLRFRPSRIPSYLPDLAIAVPLDLITGSWRLAFWGYGASAFLLLAILGGWIGARIAGLGLGLGLGLADAALRLGLLMAALMLAGLLVHGLAAGERPFEVADAHLLVNPQVLMMMPVWHGGAFILGLGLIALAWRLAGNPSLPGLVLLALLSVAASVSNTIIIAHAILPALIALAEGGLRGRLTRRGAFAVAAALAIGPPIGLWLGAAAGRQGLPIAAAESWGTNALAAIMALPAQPIMALLLLASLPLALAFLFERRAAALLAVPGRAPTLRFFIVAAAAACGAALLISLSQYGAPMGWRYAMPLAWWPVIFAALLLPLPGARLVAGLAVAASAGLFAIQALAGGSVSPALMRWRHPALACLDAADPAVTLRAGLAPYWEARTIAASSDWRRQVESTDFGDARPLLWIADPRSFVQARDAPLGTPPAYRFILMDQMDPAAITLSHGPPAQILRCGATVLWVYPPGWDPLDRLIAQEPELLPEARAIGRQP